MLPIPGLDPGTVDPSEAAFASGMLAGAGLREISQSLGLSRKRGGAGAKGSGAMPSAATMLQGNVGPIDQMMLLARLKETMGQGMGSPSADPMDPMAAPMPGGPAGPLPMGPGALPPPMGGPGPLPMGPPPIAPGPPLANPGGALPLQLLMQMLQGTGGVV